MSYGVGQQLVALIKPLVWEPPYTVSAALKSKKKKKKKKKKKQNKTKQMNHQFSKRYGPLIAYY